MAGCDSSRGDLALLRRWLLPLIGLAVLPGVIAWACPFCSAVSMTLSEEIKAADAAIVASLVKLPPQPTEDQQAKGNYVPAEMAKGTFEVVEVLKGPATLKPKQKIEILFFGQKPVGTKFFIAGTDPKDLAWGTPVELTERGSRYLAKLVKLPESGTQRLLFFQDYLEDKDPLLAGDAYDEFAKTPYAEVAQIKDQMRHDKLLEWIKAPDTSTSRRRLYLTMLGVCGTKADLPALEAMMKDPQGRPALDALIACYLNLDGAAGMPLVEDLFLKNPKAEYTDTYAAIMALRFHGQETHAVPKERLVEGLRYMLDRPQLADLVIPDLARWQDWSVMGRLVKLFKDAKEDTVWVRVPVINYLRACPLPEAKVQIAELKKIDPESVDRASQFFPLAAATPPPGSQRPKAESSSDKGNTAKASPDKGGPAPPPTKKVAAAAPKSKSDKAPAGTPPAAKPTADTPVASNTAAGGGKVKKPTAVVMVNQPAASGQTERVIPVGSKTAEESPPNRAVTWSLLGVGGVLLILAGVMRGNRRREPVSKA
jgi:hypothetical protein